MIITLVIYFESCRQVYLNSGNFIKNLFNSCQIIGKIIFNNILRHVAILRRGIAPTFIN